jgi:hypothetical protein
MMIQRANAMRLTRGGCETDSIHLGGDAAAVGCSRG